MTMRHGVFNKMRLKQLGGSGLEGFRPRGWFLRGRGDDAAVHRDFLANAATNGAGMHTILGVVGVCSRSCGSFVIRHIFVEFS